MARAHRQTPEQALIGKEWKECNRLAWALRKLTGEALELGIRMRVPEHLRDEVRNMIKGFKRKHGKE